MNYVQSQQKEHYNHIKYVVLVILLLISDIFKTFF